MNLAPSSRAGHAEASDPAATLPYRDRVVSGLKSCWIVRPMATNFAAIKLPNVEQVMATLRRAADSHANRPVKALVVS
ncbi:hypothetical protein [Bradyrhizobium sp. RDT46]|uniref:hypothetical protein n=1 Tax=Bradyrhizobium sp. RDT46 TaxID=3341829 RepID=UPI0035C7694B